MTRAFGGERQKLFMNKLPLALWIISAATVAVLIIGFVTDSVNLVASGLIGAILTGAAFAMYLTRNDPPQDDDDETLERW